MTGRPDGHPGGTCDWGGCNNTADGWRYDRDAGWLPVCLSHSGPDDRGAKTAPLVRQPTPHEVAARLSFALPLIAHRHGYWRPDGDDPREFVALDDLHELIDRLAAS